MNARGVELLPERAVWWPAARTLLVADLHWGKEETFHASGIPVPSTIEADLHRLEVIIRRQGADRVVVLGDLVHGPLFPATIERIASFRARVPVLITLVRGNHDRHAPQLPPEWDIVDQPSLLREGPFAFTHVPVEVPGHYTWAGHLHPMYTLRGAGDHLRLPCFHLGEHVGVLPAFGAFTGGVGVRRAPGDEVYVVAEGRVVQVGGSETRAASRRRGYHC